MNAANSRPQNQEIATFIMSLLSASTNELRDMYDRFRRDYDTVNNMDHLGHYDKRLVLEALMFQMKSIKKVLNDRRVLTSDDLMDGLNQMLNKGNVN